MQNSSPFKIGEEKFTEIRNIFEQGNKANARNLVAEIQPAPLLPIPNSPPRDYSSSPVLNEDNLHEDSPRKHLLTPQPQPQTPINSGGYNLQISENEVRLLINSDAHNTNILASESPLSSRFSCFSGVRFRRGTQVVPVDAERVQATVSASLAFVS
jgi:hypothetical protein